MSDLEAILETGTVAAVEVAAAHMAEKGQPPGPCANCGIAMIGAYCAVCGQERDTHRRSVWGLMKVFFEDVLSFDSRILRSLIALLVEPGELAIAFREGRTRRYVPAIRAYFFVTLIFFVLLSVSNLAILQLEVTATPEQVVHNAKGYFLVSPDAKPTNSPDEPNLIPIGKDKALEPGQHYAFNTKSHFFSPVGAYHSKMPPDALARLNKYARNGNSGTVDPTGMWVTKSIYGALSKLAADPAALNSQISTWIPRVLFLLLPLYALLLALFYVRQRKHYYFVDHLVFSLNMHTFVFIILMIAVGIAQLFDSESVFWMTILAIGIYIFIAMKRFYRQSWFWTSVKFAAVSCIYTFVFLIPALVGVLALSVFGGSFG